MKTEAEDTIDYNPIAQHTTGLTKREYFAAMAMQGLLAMSSNGDLIKALNDYSNETGNEPEHYIASMSVSHADALINALNKTK